MKTILASSIAITIFVAAAYGLADKYSHPNYQVQNNRARHRAASMNGAQPPLARPTGTRAQLDKELKKLEAQTAAAQAHPVARPAAKVWALPKPNPPQAEKNKPINFQYAAPKNRTVQNNSAANGSTRKLIKPRYR